MGAAAGVLGASPRSAGLALTPEEELFASKVLHYELQHGALALKLSQDNPDPLPESEVFRRVQLVWRAAVDEMNVPLADCSHPAVIIYKYHLLSAAEAEEFDQSVLRAAVARDHYEFKVKHHNPLLDDFSSSFGGTKEDHTTEKDAAELLRGSMSVSPDINTSNKQIEGFEEVAFHAIKTIQTQHKSQLFAMRKHAKWMRFLSDTGCYMYIHPLSREVVSNRPEEYVEEGQSSEDNQTGDGQGEVDETGGLQVVVVDQLIETIENIALKEGKTPLILDCSAEQIARSFYSYKACLEDVSCFMVPFGVNGVHKEDVMEKCRKKLVAAMVSEPRP